MNKYGLIVVLVLLLYGVYFLNQKEQKVELINTTDEKEAAIPKENKKLTSASLENSVNSEQKRTKPSSSQTSPSSPFSNKKEPDTEKETTSDQQKPNDIITTMPSSYPIEEAEKYFLPPEERTSGHIGGPPPLNFPKLGN